MPLPVLAAAALGTVARVAAPAAARALGSAAGRSAGSALGGKAAPFMLGRMSMGMLGGGGDSEPTETRNSNFSQGSMSSTSPDSDRARFAYMHGLTG